MFNKSRLIHHEFLYFLTGFIFLYGLTVQAGSFTVDRRLDLPSILGEPLAAQDVPGMAFDGDYLWLIHPNGDRLFKIDPNNARLDQTISLPTAIQNPGPMAVGLDQIWLLEVGNMEVISIDTRTYITLNYPFSATGTPVGIDFRPDSEPGISGVIIILMQESQSEYPVEHRYKYSPASGLQFDKRVPDTLPNAVGVQSTQIGGNTCAWMPAPRVDIPQNEFDIDDDAQNFRTSDRDPVIIDLDLPATSAPDNSIPRGGQAIEDSHRLVLLAPDRMQPDTPYQILSLYVAGDPPKDFAVSDTRIFYPRGNAILDLSLKYPTDLEYGACACRDIKYHYEAEYDNFTSVNINFSMPYDAGLPEYEEDATAGYLAQEVKGLIYNSPANKNEFYYKLTSESGSSQLVRQGRTFYPEEGDLFTEIEASYKIRVETCEAKYNILPGFIGSINSIPASVRQLYTYDGNKDGFGDNHPDTCEDDFLDIDSAIVHSHLVASGALGESNLYWKARRIHDYIKRRHVYSSAEGGWADPETKLESAYATCSPSSFMVAVTRQGNASGNCFTVLQTADWETYSVTLPIDTPTYKLTINTVPAAVDSTSPSTGDTYHPQGSVVDLSAFTYVNCPDVYSFDYWDGDVADTTTSDTTITMTSDKVVTAYYNDARQCGGPCKPYPQYDLNLDCKVDLVELSLISSEFLSCTIDN